LADCVDRLLAEPALRAAMGHAARLRALQRSWESVNAVLLREYEALAGAQPALARSTA
jgi:hypothetical protein